ISILVSKQMNDKESNKSGVDMQNSPLGFNGDLCSVNDPVNESKSNAMTRLKFPVNNGGAKVVQYRDLEQSTSVIESANFDIQERTLPRAKLQIQDISVLPTDHSNINIHEPIIDESIVRTQTLPKDLFSGKEFTCLPIDLQNTPINKKATIDSRRTARELTVLQPICLQTPPPRYKHLVHLFLTDEPPTYYAATGIKVASAKEPDLTKPAHDGQTRRCCSLNSICGKELTRFEIVLRVLAGLVFIIIGISIFKNVL
uniref:Uncharacterized protein n=1 Tax=Clytia hemisphaerica TaxID=252671 RepID=A0A7M5WLM8_9CNID